MDTNKRTRIKICGITREQDADCAVAAGADALGFVLYPPSPRAVSLARAVELARRLPAFVTPVLLFVNADDALLQAARAALPHALWQFHGDESPERCNLVTNNGQQAYIRAARIPLQDAVLPAAGAETNSETSAETSAEAHAKFDLLEFAHLYQHARAILLDAAVEGYGGGGKAFNWSQLPTNVAAHIVLSGGLTPANVGDGVRLLRPRCKTLAVDVSSGVESAKGIKDADKIHAFIAAVRAADGEIS